MNETEITASMKRVLAGIAPEADLDTLGPNDNLREELELDSIDFLHFLVGLHQELGVEIPESDYGNLTSTAAIVDYVQEQAPQPKRAG